MSETFALISHPRPDAVLAIDRAQPILAGQFVADVEAQAARLPPGRYLLNGCSQRYAFAVSLCAAALAGRICLLPHSRTADAIARVCEPYRRAEPGGGHGLGIVTDGGDVLLDAPVAFFARAGGSRWPPPRLAADTPVAIAFTSGTTGAPQANLKTWGPLVASARAEAIALGLGAHVDPGQRADAAAPINLLATVPPQHMYGLESSVLIALQNGWAFDASQPLHPQGIAASVATLAPPTMLVTTPTHLRAMLNADVRLERLRLVVCATAPLSAAIASEVESRWGCELREIYGCTETGQVASRRPTHSAWWTPLPGVRVFARDGQYYASGPPIACEAMLGDELQLRDDGDFQLLGRDSDRVNVGGRRASLAGLSAILLEIEGVDDGLYFVPAVNGPDAGGRLAAAVVAPRLSRGALIAELRRRIDPLFLPRPLHLLDALPRNAVGKISISDLHRLSESATPARGAADGTRQRPIDDGHAY